MGAVPGRGTGISRARPGDHQPPHFVVFAADTDNTGTVEWPRFRTGLVASLLTDHTYFACDYGPRDHGGVTDWWFPEYYTVALGEPLGPYTADDGVYRRDFERGTVIAASTSSATVAFTTLHRDIATGGVGAEFTAAGRHSPGLAPHQECYATPHR